MRTVSLFFFVFFMLLIQPIKAQKVAVVLSGGGAKGVCHIGFLKALEENNIPIDYIAGTSMGAIIGGMYAAGYTPTEMEQLVTSPIFQKWAEGVIGDDYYHYYKQEDPNAAWFKLRFNYSEKLKPRLPTNLVSPFEMDYQFMEVFAAASAASNYNFDSLMIPFRCVAADIFANKPYVADTGCIGTAVRASMTFPFYFKPIKIGGRLMFDGGMYNNFPVDVAIKTFNPDVILGCKAAADGTRPESDDIISQLENMLMAKTIYELPEGCKGLVVKPKLIQVDVTDFRFSRALIDSGYSATLNVLDSIKGCITARTDSSEREKRRNNFRYRKPELFVDSIIVKGLNPAQAKYVTVLINHKPREKMIGEYKTDYFRLIADDRIKYVFPQLRFNPYTGYFNLLLEVQQSEIFEADFGGNISSSATNEGFIQLKYNYLGRNASSVLVNSYFGRFYSSIRLKGRADFPSENPYFVESEYIYNYYDFFKSNSYFIEDKTPSFLLKSESFLSAAIGWPVTTNGIMRLGLNVGENTNRYYHTNVIQRNDTLDRTDFRFVGAYLCVDFNSFNRKQFPTSGSRFKAALRFIGGNENHYPGSTSLLNERSEYRSSFFQIDLMYDNYFEQIGPLKLGMYGELLISNLEFSNNYTASVLQMPQFSPIPAAQMLFLPKFRSPNALAIGSKNLFQVTRRFDIRMEAYVYQPLREVVSTNTQTATYRKYFSDRSFMGSMAVVFDTFFGPVSFSLNYFDKETESWAFLFNIGYTIFNPSPR